MYIDTQRQYKKVHSTCFQNWKQSKCQLLVKWMLTYGVIYTTEYYAGLKKELLLSNNMLVSSVKAKKPDIKNIGCIKFKTGKANLGGTDWGKKGMREGYMVVICSIS